MPDVVHTIVGPSWLTDQPAGGGVRVERGDRGGGGSGRDDPAAACVAALGDRNAHGKTFELYATEPHPRLTGRPSSRGSAPTSDGPRRE